MVGGLGFTQASTQLLEAILQIQAFRSRCPLSKGAQLLLGLQCNRDYTNGSLELWT